MIWKSVIVIYSMTELVALVFVFSLVNLSSEPFRLSATGSTVLNPKRNPQNRWARIALLAQSFRESRILEELPWQIATQSSPPKNLFVSCTDLQNLGLLVWTVQYIVPKSLAEFLPLTYACQIPLRICIDLISDFPSSLSSSYESRCWSYLPRRYLIYFSRKLHRCVINLSKRTQTLVESGREWSLQSQCLLTNSSQAILSWSSPGNNMRQAAACSATEES